MILPSHTSAAERAGELTCRLLAAAEVQRQRACLLEHPRVRAVMHRCCSSSHVRALLGERVQDLYRRVNLATRAAAVASLVHVCLHRPLRCERHEW